MTHQRNHALWMLEKKRKSLTLTNNFNNTWQSGISQEFIICQMLRNLTDKFPLPHMKTLISHARKNKRFDSKQILRKMAT